MKDVYEHLLGFLESQEEFSNDFQSFKQYLYDQKIQEKDQGFIEFLHMLSEISINHYPTPDFHKRVEQILLSLKDPITKNLTNFTAFNIFKSNKRALLFLFEQKIIVFNKRIYYAMKNDHFLLNYFLPEVTLFLSEQSNQKTKPFPESFENNRKIGENPNYICQLIRNDSIEEFIAYVNRNQISLSNTILNSSFFDTNPYFKNRKFTLIQYATFYGSIQIFNYLRRNGVKLTKILWNCAVHSNNPEIIHSLEDDHVECDETTLLFYLLEAIKCHHNDIANYIILQNNNLFESLTDYSVSLILRYYNFLYIKESIFDKSWFFHELARNDYYALIKILMTTTKIDINALSDDITKLFVQTQQLYFLQ